MLLQDKICVIAGAASLRGIGYATAQLFAEQGAKLALVDVAMTDSLAAKLRDSVETAVGRSVEVIGMQCDIANSESCNSMARQVAKHFGTIDCLVNSAAIVKSAPLLSIEDSEFDVMVDVNLKGAFNLCRSVLPIMLEAKSGSIVNVASVAAQRGGGAVGGAHYAASKGGVISLTRTVARELGPQGVRANVVCPSMTETGMLDGNVTDEMFQQIIAAIPLKRAGKARDIAGACLFLASDLSAYVTGATLDVNGGSHIH